MEVIPLGIVEFLQPNINVFPSFVSKQLFSDLYTLLLAFTVIKVRRLQLENAASSIYVTLLGIITDVRPQLIKALLPINVTKFGISILCRDRQP